MCKEYQHCLLCPRNCGTDRRTGKGYCGCSDLLLAARAGLHYYEEPFLSGNKGSGTVFFSGCSLGCIYCQNDSISRDHVGWNITIPRLAEVFLEQQERGAHNLNLVTGTHFTPSIAKALETARKNGLHIPVVWNSSGYEKPETLYQLEGLADIFLPDFKTLSAELGSRYFHAPDYAEWAKEALSAMVQMAGEPVFEEMEDAGSETGESGSDYEGENVLLKKGVVVRHMVVPGQKEDSKEVLKYLFDTYGNRIWISLMSQYTPVGAFAGNGDAGLAAKYPELIRTVSREEYEEIVDYAIELGIEKCMIQEDEVASDSFIPAFDGSGIVE